MDRSPQVVPRPVATRDPFHAVSRWIAAVPLILLIGCQARVTPSDDSAAASADGRSQATTRGSATDAAPAVRTTEGAVGASGRTHQIVISDGTDGGRYCVRVSQPRQPVRHGDGIRWVSKASRRIMIDINGTSPMGRGHFELEPNGSDGDVITYQGDKVFHYSVLPAGCPGDQVSHQIVVGSGGQ